MLFRRRRQSTATEPESFFVESIWLIRPTHSQPLIGIAAGICCLCHPREPVDTQPLISVVVSIAAFRNHKFLLGGPWRPDVQLTFGDFTCDGESNHQKGADVAHSFFLLWSGPIRLNCLKEQIPDGLARRDWTLLPACRLDPNVPWKHSCLSEHSVFSSSALLALSLTAGTESAPLSQTVYSCPGMSRVRLEAQVLFWVVSCLTGTQCYLLFALLSPIFYHTIILFRIYYDILWYYDIYCFFVSTAKKLACLA